MIAEFVSASKAEPVYVPAAMGLPSSNQMLGTTAEQLVELCGRVCYDSLGKGRASDAYHQHLVDSKHYSVHEHVHFTVETDLSPIVWVGIPDVSIAFSGDYVRVTFNLRHAIEWPTNVTMYVEGDMADQLVKAWTAVLNSIVKEQAPTIFAAMPSRPSEDLEYMPESHFRLVHPQRDTEAFVSLFLEDSRVFSHEMVRHRGNISQRSGRYVDETNRTTHCHPLLRDYLNEVGYLAADGEDTEDVVVGSALSVDEAAKRTKLGNVVGQLNAQASLIYGHVVDELEKYAIAKGVDKRDARKQARSAGRYYLGNGLSTEMIFTASIRHWRHIFKNRVNPAADAAIREVMEQAERIVRGTLYGHLL